MSPTACAVLLLFALVVDWLSMGANSIRDKLAFLMGLAAINVGFDGSPLDRWTVGVLSALIDKAKEQAGDAYIAGAITAQLIGAAVLVLAVYTIGCLMPDRFAKKLGKYAAMAFPSTKSRINWKLWVCAALLGMMCDLPVGWGGDTLRFLVDLNVDLCSTVPAWLFGVS